MSTEDRILQELGDLGKSQARIGQKVDGIEATTKRINDTLHGGLGDQGLVTTVALQTEKIGVIGEHAERHTSQIAEIREEQARMILSKRQIVGWGSGLVTILVTITAGIVKVIDDIGRHLPGG